MNKKIRPRKTPRTKPAKKPSLFQPADRAELRARVEARAGALPHEDPYGYIDEGHRRIAVALVALQEVKEEVLPWFGEAHDAAPENAKGPLGRMAFKLNGAFMSDKIDAAIGGCISALDDFASLQIVVRELSGGVS
jgi:hypothetical protein